MLKRSKRLKTNMETESNENISRRSSSKEAFAISSDSDDSFIANNPTMSPVHIDFDDLKNDILEMENPNPSTFDQLLSSINSIDDIATEDNAVHDNQEDTNSNTNTNEMGDETDGNASNDVASTTSTNATVDTAKNSVGIKLVPIESLMRSNVDSTGNSSSSSRQKDKNETVKCHSEKLKEKKKSSSSSSSSSPESVDEISSEKSSDDDDNDNDNDDRRAARSRHKRQCKQKTDLKERFKELRQKAQTKRPNYAERSNSDDSDDNSDRNDVAKSTRRTRTRNAVTPTTPPPSRDVYGATVLLTKLPSNMKSLLYKYDLIEIRDRHQKILASRPRTHRNEKPSKSVSKRLLNDGNCETNDQHVDNQLTDPPAKKQKLNQSIQASTSKKSGKHKPTLRKHQNKPRYVISTDSSSNNNSSLSDKNTDADNADSDDKRTRSKRKMRKKNIPKSSTDVTDSNNSASENNSDAENNGGKSSSSEVEVRTKRKRVPVRKQPSDDDDDDDYSEPKKKYKRRKRIKKVSDSSDENTPKKLHGRKNIRKVIRTADLEQETKEAAKHELERKKRIEERQKLYNQMYDNKLEEITELDKLVLDFDPETKEELISVDKRLVKKLKPHQGQGVKFMWDASFESLEKLNENHGGGCILAHCMGLGKTLQVVALVHTLLTHSEQTNVEKVLIICPVSTVLNWVNEFKIWLRHCSQNRDIEIYEISKYKQNAERAYRISEWHNEGGVLILGYDMFRNLSSETSRIRKKQKEIFQEGLINPGPDLVVCDEGHLLKNSKTSLSKAVNRITTMRRIVLTGTPLQNNLNEYYCMVQFVKPNLLGKYNEYLNRFVNPITNGQYTDSTPYDIQMMKRRSHILHKLLDGCVQRRDYSVLAPFLPPKQEYVLYIRLTKLQVDLYKYYMANRPTQNESGRTRSSILFQDFQNLQRIWTHPRVLRYNSDRYEQMVQKKRFLASDDEEGSLKDFIDDDDDDSEDDSDLDNSSSSDSEVAAASSNDSSVQSVHSDKPSNSKKAQQQQQQQGQANRRTRSNAKDFDPEPIEPIKEENPTEWWMSLCPEEELNNIEHSSKLMLLFSILAECEACGDKLLVFSQSLFSLDVIEHFLAMIDENTQNPNPDAKLGGFSGNWARGVDYFRLDGSTNIETRNANCNNFNSDENPRARLFLISTRAGGLGINLVAANRVIIFDASWNPSHDIQSIFRIYRFGQRKPCYIYRFIAYGTMEEKIYERQVTKLAISKRVIDEHQIDRHYKENDLNELYNIENIDPEEDRPLVMPPKDRLFAEQLQKYSERIWKYHEHDSLLENKSEETLSKEEIEAAWKEFEEEKNRPTVQQTFVGYPTYQRAPGTGPVTSNNIFGFRTDILLQLLNIKARRAYPGLPNVSEIVPMLLKHLYETMEKNDTSFYQELLYIQQTEMAAPSQGSYLTPAGHIMPAYSGRGRPPLNPQQGPVQHVQQQHLIHSAQNRLMNMNNGNPRLPPPTVSPHVIEID